MKTRKTIVLTTCLLLVGLASAQLSEEWVAEYDPLEPGDEHLGKAIAVDDAGHVYVTGSCRWGVVYMRSVIKYDPSTGETLWVRYSPGYHVPRAMAVDASGSVYVTGTGYITVKYNSDGVQQWISSYNPSGGYTDEAFDIVVDVDGSVYVTGRSDNGQYTWNYATVKYDANGNQLWVTRYDPGNGADATAIALDAAGNVYVTGRGQAAGQSFYATIKYEPDGDIAWTQYTDGAAIYDGPGNWAEATAIAVDGDGNVSVTGNCGATNMSTKYATVRYNSSGDELWARGYDGPGAERDEACGIALDGNGNTYVTGWSSGSGTGSDYATIKYEPDGDIAWTQYTDGAARYSGPGSHGDLAVAIAVDAPGSAYVTGYSGTDASTMDYATIKYEPDGDIAWTQYTDGVAFYNGPDNDYDLACGIAADASGNVYVTGYSGVAGISDWEYATVKYDGSGSQVWVARYRSFFHTDDRGQKVAFDATGNVIVAGQTTGKSSNTDYVTIKYSPSTGDTLWVRRYSDRYYNNGSPAGIDCATAMTADASGNVYVTGYSYFDYATIKYTPNGDIAWTQYTGGAARYNGPFKGYDYAYALAVDAEGNVYVTGCSQSATNNYDYATVKYDAEGNQLWVALYDGPANGNDIADAIAVDASGNVSVTGHSASQAVYPYTYDYATIKYDAGGNVVAGWPQRYNGPGNRDDQAAAIAMDASGNVYVTGYSASQATNPYNYDYATIKYTTNGDVAWTQYTGGAARYNGPANNSDAAKAIALDGEGNAYVTGESWGYNSDYATIKYKPDGSIAWTQYSDGAARYNGPAHGSEGARAIALDAAGVYVTGYSQGLTSGDDYATVMYDRATGSQLGDCMRHSGPGANRDQALSIATGPAGAVAVTGQSRVPVLNELVENNNIVTILYSTGTADVGVAEILEPSGLIDTLSETPVVTVQNYGTRKVSFTVWFEIKDPSNVVRYLESVTVTDLEGETPLTVNTFPVWDVPNDLEGQYTCRSWTVLSGDLDPSNDQATSTFGVEASPQSPSQWTQQTDVPEGLQRRVVQHGSCAATDPEGRYLYFLKGDNTCEFYRYDPATATWIDLEPIPEYGRDNVSRTVKEGGTLAQIGGKFYATKGGNSTEFWEYDPAAQPSSHWTQMADVTDGTHSGASACGVSILSEGYIYLLRASATFDFYRYSVTDNAWEVMANAPGPDTEAFKLGSSITCNGMGTIYALKGIYNRFYSYSVATNTWSPLADLPLGAKNKQAKGGAAICYHLGKVYCLKGSNSQEFWIYDCNANSWVQDADVPLGDDKTRVQDGGTLVYCSLSRYLFATKGGTLELWSYGKLTNYEGPMGAASVTTPVRFSLAVSPSVTNSRARIAYGIPKAGNVSLKLYDVTGRSAATFRNGWLEPGRYTADVEAGTLARGIYILKLEADSRNLTRKLVIE